MSDGTLYGIGVWPGDPELITVKGAGLLARCRDVFVPKARTKADSVALAIAGQHVSAEATVREIVFPMIADPAELKRRWDASAEAVAEVLTAGRDACFLTLGDPLLYSTYIYLVRSLRERWPAVEVVTVPGITAYSAAAALTSFPVGEGKEPVVIVPAADDMDDLRRALAMGGTVVLMKIGKRLEQVLDVLEATGTLARGVFVSRAGMPEQRIETDLAALRGQGEEVGYLSIILVHAAGEGGR